MNKRTHLGDVVNNLTLKQHAIAFFGTIHH